MFLQRLQLRHFRLFEDIEFHFCNGLNLFYGANAQGKTTILEAIHVLMTGRSFRTSQLTDLIQEGKDFFYLEASFSKQGIEQRIKISSDGKIKRLFYNQTELHSFSGLFGILQGVIMTPDDIALIKGSPSGRRSFLDMQIAQIDPLYVHHLMRYSRAIKQRNVLLRSKRIEAIEGWEQEMSLSAAYIVTQRIKILEDLQMTSNLIHQGLTDTSQSLQFGYVNDLRENHDLQKIGRDYLYQWQKSRKREMELGFTLFGPHKDDFTIAIDQKEARYFASEGQQRSCVSALRLAEWEIMKKRIENPPLMLIDDFGMSLDGRRRQHLKEYIETLEQVFITSTENLQFQSQQVPSRSLELVS
jgi:DNA replication and repair protein RecF